MKSKDLFAGCSVTVMPHDDVWGVSLNTLDLHMVVMRSYMDLPAALEVVHQWMQLLEDETEVAGEDVTSGTLDNLRETLARHAAGEDVRPPEQVNEDEMLTWFEREMGKSRSDGE